MVAEPKNAIKKLLIGCSLAKISMVAERWKRNKITLIGCSLAKISMVAELESEV